MIYLIHALVGGLIGGYLNSVPVVIVLAVLSHFLLDMLPHWDGPYDKSHFEKTGILRAHKAMYYIKTVDFIAAAISVIIFAELFPMMGGKMMALGAICSLAPDMLKIGYFSPLRKKKAYMRYLKFHSKIQNEVGWKFGILSQTMMLIALIVAFHFV
jgi:hypothetical protein